MIPTAYIQEWTAATPWPDPRQVEQDLIVSRATVPHRLSGEAWHRSEPVIEELRATAFPNLLRHASV